MTAPETPAPIDTNTHGDGRRISGKRKWRIGVSVAATAIAATSIINYTNTNDTTTAIDSYQENLQLIESATVRNSLHDNSVWRETKQANLVNSNHFGPRSDYLNNPNGNPERSFPTGSGGQFRTSCEFSHFGYDDPILAPDEPGGNHLHMFFGNTELNAYTTQETLEDSGSSTCNGQELNRSGYWVPAMFDGAGNVRIPERIVVYYKGEGFANAGNRTTNIDGSANPGSQPYERGMRNIAPNPASVPEVSQNDGGATGEVNYKCTSNFSPFQFADGVNNIPNCDGDYYDVTFGAPYPATRTVLEMEVKFWNCFPTGNTEYEDWTLWEQAGTGRGSWFFSNCTGGGGPGPGVPNDKEIYPNMSYFVNYVVEPGEDTSAWFLASDVDKTTLSSAAPTLVAGGAGSTHHGDVWWSWKPDINQMWIDNCVNFKNPLADSGCGFGYLSDAGPDGRNPLPGDALKYRPQFDTVGDSASYKVPASQVFNELCLPHGPSHGFVTDEHAAWCKT